MRPTPAFKVGLGGAQSYFEKPFCCVSGPGSYLVASVLLWKALHYIVLEKKKFAYSLFVRLAESTLLDIKPQYNSEPLCWATAIIVL